MNIPKLYRKREVDCLYSLLPDTTQNKIIVKFNYTRLSNLILFNIIKHLLTGIDTLNF